MPDNTIDPNKSYQVTFAWNKLSPDFGKDAFVDRAGKIVGGASSNNFTEIFDFANTADSEAVNQAIKQWFRDHANEPVSNFPNGPTVTLQGSSLISLHKAANPAAQIIPGVPNPIYGNVIGDVMIWLFGDPTTQPSTGDSSGNPPGENPNPGILGGDAGLLATFGNLFGFLFSPTGLALIGGVALLYIGFKYMMQANTQAAT